MSSCPNCQKQIEIKEEHYGTLYRCAYCKSEFFVDFSGQPENSKEAPPIEEGHLENFASEELPLAANPEPAILPEMSAENSPQSGLDFLNSNFQPLPILGAEPSEMPSHDEAAMTSTPEPIAEPEPVPEYEPIPIAEQSNSSFDVGGGASFLNEISDFGNEVQTHSGVLNFNITIDDIDLPEQKNLLLEQLEDRRFGFDMDEVKEKLKYGKIEIHNLPAPKAIVLIQRLQGIALKISWSENVITQ